MTDVCQRIRVAEIECSEGTYAGLKRGRSDEG